MSYQVFPENPMIFPDNRDSVTKQLRALVAKWRDPSFLPANDFAASFALNCADDLAGVIDAPWHDPQALARGPQQAGGEDAPEKVVAWMNEREAWRSPRAPSEPGTHALVLADDYAALQAEVARLREGIVHRGDDVVVPLPLFDEINASGFEWMERAHAAEAALREAGRDAGRWRFLTSMDVGEYIGLVEYNNPDKLAAAIDAARLVRDGDSGEG